MKEKKNDTFHIVIYVILDFLFALIIFGSSEFFIFNKRYCRYKINLKNFQVTQRTPDTPLTGRNYLGPKPKDQSQESPLSTATKTVACLQSLLNGRLPSTSPTLSQIFQ